MMQLPHPHSLKGEVQGYTRSSLSQTPPTSTLAPPPAQSSLTSQIIQDRILGVSAHPSLLWNSPPGALLVLPSFSTSPSDFPFYHLQQGRPWGWDNLKSPHQLSPSPSQPQPQSPAKTLPESPTFLLAPGVPNSGHSPGESVPSHPNSLCLIPPGSRPADRFSALIWVGAPGQPPLKLIQAVAGSQHCAQVCPLASCGPGIQGGGKVQGRAFGDIQNPRITMRLGGSHKFGGRHREDFQLPLLLL